MSKPVFQIIGNIGDTVFGSVTYPAVIRINEKAQGHSPYTTSLVASAPVGYTTAQERAVRISANPRRSAALAKARQRFGDWLQQEQPEGVSGLVALRLQAGISQTELAALLKKPQSNVSRLEKGEADPKMSTVLEIASALKMDVGRVAEAFARSKTNAGAEAI